MPRREPEGRGRHASSAASRAKSAGASVSGRAFGSMPAEAICSAVSRPFSERPSVLRRIEKSCATRLANRAWSRTANGGAACGTSRTTVDQTFGGGAERAGADVEAGLGARKEREHDRQAPVLFAARRGRHAVDDFALEHHVQVLDDRREGREMEQQRRRDVVGQVADDA